ncbi:diguanylate cyclase [Clostridium sp. D53t1_180928_C8]|uniref:diguanylate cyclase domain-containing protein n=1 Tax=Clostridium sp. D53t1_180928_C8 TaxID=2787101 RepID=UPI0018A970ED|nr:diguanylate cyclase [Clostridium sp. D53t1_180928_C8]
MEYSLLISIIENSQSGFILLDENRRVLYTNKIVNNYLGINKNELIGNYFNCNLPIKEKVICSLGSQCNSCILNNSIKEVFQSKKSKTIYDFEIKKNNLNLKVSLTIALHLNKYITLEVEDISNSYYKLSFLTKLANKSKDFMAFKNNSLKYEYLNKGFADFINKDQDYIIGKTDLDLVNENLFSKVLYEQCLVGDMKALKSGYYYGIETIGDRYFRVSKEKIDNGLLCIARDITDEMKAIAISETDSLTGLYNRNKFMKVIDEIYSEKKNYFLALIDLDDLRNLNNKYGHLKGDNYLNMLASVLKESADATFFRIGGDEFAALIQCNGDRNCTKHVEDIFTDVFNSLNSVNFNPKLSISVGIKKLDLNKDYLTNYEETDKLLYKVKESGKNSFIIG